MKVNTMVTMGDIAKKAGVSRATVSYVLNQRHQGRLNPETQQRVLMAAEELGYRPNLAAQGLKNRKSMMVGILVQNSPNNQLTHPLTWAFVLGINDGLAHSGYSTLLVRLTDVEDDGGLSAPVFRGHVLDGMIVVNMIPPQLEKRVEELVPQCVWLDGNVWREERCVRRDEVYAGKLAVQELAQRGYKRIICLQSWQDDNPHYSYHDRLQGAFEGASEYSVKVEELVMPFTSPTPHIPFSNQIDWNALHKLIHCLSPDEAILPMNIYTAHNFMEACIGAGKIPGKDFGVACCDDGFCGAGLDWGGLSRVSFDRYAMGLNTGQMMHQVLEGPLEPCPSLSLCGAWIEGNTARATV